MGEAGVTNYLLYALILAALAIGYFLGRREERRGHASDEIMSADLVTELAGVGPLTEANREEAFAKLVDSLSIDDATPNAQIAVGGLVRRRGEVDRAIEVHQQVLARSDLTDELRGHAELELARDYLAAGLLGRAEDLLEQTARRDGLERRVALDLLLNVYERERDWDSAIHTAQQLDQSDATEIKVALAHYHCERAEGLLDEARTSSARRALERAIAYDPHCVRAFLALAGLEDDPATTIELLEQVPKQNPRFVRETLDLLESAHLQLGSLARFRAWLEDVVSSVPSFSAVARCARLREASDGPESARQFITEQLLKRPSVRGLHALIALHREDRADDPTLTILSDVTGAMMENQPVYRCESCGFSGRTLRWQCPSCKTWGSVAPILGLEGE